MFDSLSLWERVRVRDLACLKRKNLLLLLIFSLASPLTPALSQREREMLHNFLQDMFNIIQDWGAPLS